jgi:phosphatidate phosphatase LPIN
VRHGERAACEPAHPRQEESFADPLGADPAGGDKTPTAADQLTDPLATKQFIKSVKPSSEELESLGLQAGMNTIRFRAVEVAQQVSARVYLWDYRDKIVISDVDGTITKSDVVGHILTFVGKDWSHAGVAKLYTAVRQNGYRMMCAAGAPLRACHEAHAASHNLKFTGLTQNLGQL